MNALPLLAADWLQSLGPLLLVVFWVLRQVLTAKQEEEPAPRGGRVEEKSLEEKLLEATREEQEGPGGQQARTTGGPEAQRQRAEIEEFRRRIGQLRDDLPEQAAAGEDAEEPPPRTRPRDPFEEPRRRAPVAARGAGEVELLIDDEAEAAAAESERAASPVGGLAEKHLPESQLAEQAAHLGDRIAAADERFESRLTDKFDHRLGRLEERGRPEQSGSGREQPEASTEDRPATEESSAAKRVKELLTRPGGFRDAVVLSEILRRPNDPFGPRSTS